MIEPSRGVLSTIALGVCLTLAVAMAQSAEPIITDTKTQHGGRLASEQLIQTSKDLEALAKLLRDLRQKLEEKTKDGND